MEEWSFAIWRSGDLIAQERTDVAGAMRKRTAKPTESLKRKWGMVSLGHPHGRGVAPAGRGEYMASGKNKPDGVLRLVQGRANVNPEEGMQKGASQYRKKWMLLGKR